VEEAEENWKEISLKEIVSVIIDNRGKTPPTVEYKTDYPLIEVNALNSGTCLINYMAIRKYVLKETYENWFRKHLKENDIIFSTVGTIGVFSILLENIGTIAQNLIGLRFEKVSPYFIYCFFKLNLENIINLDIGGVQPSIKVPHLLEMKIKCPSQSFLDKFHNAVDGNFQKIKSNTQQIQTLTQLRDNLLPKLMSGEVRVNN
jgi:type I restriction enzyme S subunit